MARRARRVEDLIGDLEAQMRAVLTRAEVQKVKDAPAYKPARAAISAIDKGLNLVEDEEHRAALEDAREALGRIVPLDGIRTWSPRTKSSGKQKVGAKSARGGRDAQGVGLAPGPLASVGGRPSEAEKTMDQSMYRIESPTAVVFVAIGGEAEGSGPGLAAEAWLWLRGTEDVEAVRIGVADQLLLPNRVDPVGFLLERAEAWAMGRVAVGERVLDTASRRPVPEEGGSHGLVSTLVGLAVDAPRLVERVEAATSWVELADVAEEARRVAEGVAVRQLGEPI